ncbi:Phenylalanine--tRNA ligase, mitochondrial [Hondaea fermentalgiana]|uniref:phenylalanine--tRNA ligase n=1 Tax=Hondaea fermentalgiana TaxID=2315210 RepID=A0A2R5GFU5_9STRA|nr:Phenylalanine--tRNA ligase, mitochondrial [Hondaea fermentalgiana]|eukprot:GBG29786.1 Phenylalanine--tRNA ligase, mitochondrial [Hondaea fermentalgiana]
MQACSEGNDALASFLVDAGADVDLTDHEGQNCAHFAFCMEHLELGNWLIGSVGVDTSAVDADGRTPLDWKHMLEEDEDSDPSCNFADAGPESKTRDADTSEDFDVDEESKLNSAKRAPRARGVCAGGSAPWARAVASCGHARLASTTAGDGPKRTSEGLSAEELVRPDDPHNNITASVAKHLGRGLLHRPNHPLQIVKQLIYDSFDRKFDVAKGDNKMITFDDLHPICTTQACFDDLLIPADHVSRRPSDTFYLDSERCLRTHTSAHQTHLLRDGYEAFLCAGDVYRRDEIDQSHYPVFHQMEGMYVMPQADGAPQVSVEATEAHLRDALESVVADIFGDVKMRWVEAYFPFTEPSMELEIWFNEEWLEVLGCGVVQQEILRNCGLGDRRAWAFGLGLERLAMVLFQIPDIRLFWTEDPRFHEQFQDGKITDFKPYSKYPACLKDISFWLSPDFHENDFFAVVREIGGDLIERVELIDEFTHPKTQRVSNCFRITFRHMDRSLTNEEIDKIQEVIRESTANQLGVELR